VLDRAGASTLTASDEAQARRLIDEIGLAPDFIVSDFRLGAGADGVAVIEALRRAYGERIAAAILTGDVAPRVMRRVREAGLPLFSKPMRPEELLAHIAERVRRPL
jgi:two-component system, sensor histidine kinase